MYIDLNVGEPFGHLAREQDHEPRDERDDVHRRSAGRRGSTKCGIARNHCTIGRQFATFSGAIERERRRDRRTGLRIIGPPEASMSGNDQCPDAGGPQRGSRSDASAARNAGGGALGSRRRPGRSRSAAVGRAPGGVGHDRGAVRAASRRGEHPKSEKVRVGRDRATVGEPHDRLRAADEAERRRSRAGRSSSCTRRCATARGSRSRP